MLQRGMRHQELAAFAKFTLHLNSTMVVVHYFLANGQTKAGTACFFICGLTLYPVKSCKNMLFVTLLLCLCPYLPDK